MPEILDLYTRDGKPTGQTMLRGEKIPEDLLHPVCNVWLVNAAGEVLIQRRSLRKPNWPGYWCCSAGGAVQHGEDPLTGALRETEEELGVTLDPALGRLLFVTPGRRALHQVWLFRQDVPVASLTLQASEVDDARYVSPAELERLIRDGKEFVNVAYLDRLMTKLTDAQTKG